MKLIILDHYSQASEWAAKYIRDCITQFNPGTDKYFTLGLPSGSTPLGCYKLIEYYKNGDKDATLELKVKTVKYFKGLVPVHNRLVDPLHHIKEKETEKSQSSKKAYSD